MLTPEGLWGEEGYLADIKELRSAGPSTEGEGRTGMVDHSGGHRNRGEWEGSASQAASAPCGEMCVHGATTYNILVRSGSAHYT